MISIIVPVYNAEQYLERCVNSILKQTIEEFELFLVDDGSTDNSGDICEQYGASDARVRVLHCKNGGCGKAREQALSRCTGQYVCFVDADDYISEDFLQRLLSAIIKEDADIACCQTMQIDGSRRYSAERFNNYEVIEKKDRLIEDFIACKDLYVKIACAKLFRRKIIENTHFSSIKFGEDSLFMCEVFINVRKLVLDPFIGYYYFRNESSITKSAEKNGGEVFVALDHVFYSEALANLGKQCSTPVGMKANDEYARAVWAAVSRMIKNNDKVLYKQKREFICCHIKNMKGLRGISEKNRVLLNVYRLSPALLWWIYCVQAKVFKSKTDMN